MSQLKELLAMGFTPAAALCIVAVAVVWLRLRWSEKQNMKIRAAWHAEANERIDTLEAHTLTCNKDRERLQGEALKLKIRVGVLDSRMKVMARCSKEGCPTKNT